MTIYRKICNKRVKVGPTPSQVRFSSSCGKGSCNKFGCSTSQTRSGRPIDMIGKVGTTTSPQGKYHENTLNNL